MGKCIKSSYKIYFSIILLSLLISNQTYNNCSVCLSPMDGKYLIDAWGNKFHQKHEQDGYYCSSCSRLISEALTHGGYKTIDNRYICSLCYSDLVYQNHIIEASKIHVINQLEKVGFLGLSNNIPVILLDKSKLLELSETAYHKNLKGFTKITKKNNNSDNQYIIYILNNLHQIEFDAVLAHEYLHVWQNNQNIKLNDADSEGLSNLASELIYKNYNNTFSRVLNNSLNNDNTIYGDGYRKMKNIKDQIGWERLIKEIIINYSY